MRCCRLQSTLVRLYIDADVTLRVFLSVAGESERETDYRLTAREVKIILTHQILEISQCRWHLKCPFVQSSRKSLADQSEYSLDAYLVSTFLCSCIPLQMRANHGDEDVVLHSTKKIHIQRLILNHKYFKIFQEFSKCFSKYHSGYFNQKRFN